MNNQCKFLGCSKKCAYRGFCIAHYQQNRYGKVLRPLQVQYHGFSELGRLMMRCDKKGPDECWNFIGSRLKKNWHGQFRSGITGKSEPAHRAAYRLLVGPIPKGVYVLHNCDNPICLNPSHLFLGSQSDNAKDMWKKGRARPKSNKGEKHGMSKLTSEQVVEIKTSNESGVSLARKFNVTPTTICDVRKGRTWNY